MRLHIVDFWKKTGTNTQATLNLVDISSTGATILPDMGIYLSPDQDATYFSNTAVFVLPSKRKIKIEIEIEIVGINTTSLRASAVNILIKKLA